MNSNNFNVKNCLNEYQNAINNKDLQLIKELNVKYSQNNLNDVVYELYLRYRLHRNVLKKIIFMSLETPRMFNVTNDFLNLIIKRNDIETLKLIFQYLYIYNNDLIKFLLYKYKNKEFLSDSEYKRCRDNEIKIINLNEPTRNNKLPLFVAYENNNENLTKFLIKNDADVNKTNNDGNTSLIIACSYNNEDIVKYLIEHGANVNKQNKYGDTPLMKAFKINNHNILIYLVEHGADVNKENKDGDIPLIIAWQDEEIVKYLIEDGADINIENE